MKNRKLTLGRETLRRLTRDSLGQVHGGSEDRQRRSFTSNSVDRNNCHTNTFNVSAGQLVSCGCTNDTLASGGNDTLIPPAAE